MNQQPTLFLDNIQFRYDPDRGVFASLSIASEDMTLDDVRRRGVTLSFYEVTVVRGIPYLYDQKADTFYRLGNGDERLTGDEFERHDLQGMVSTPYGDAFRAVVQRERDHFVGLQRSDRDR